MTTSNLNAKQGRTASAPNPSASTNRYITTSNLSAKHGRSNRAPNLSAKSHQKTAKTPLRFHTGKNTPAAGTFQSALRLLNKAP